MMTASLLAGKLKNEPRGFGDESEKPSLLGLVGSSLCRAAICLLFMLLALFLANRFVLKIGLSSASDVSSATLQAPYKTVTSLTIQLPGAQTSECEWRELGACPDTLGMVLFHE
jgi:hypothetical protein